MTLSNRAYPAAIKHAVIALIKAHYHDFGPTLIAEKLDEKHDIQLSRETLRQWLIEAGIWKNRRQRRQRVHQPRYRRDCGKCLHTATLNKEIRGSPATPAVVRLGVVDDFNLRGPGKVLGYKDMLMAIHETLKSDVKIHWMTAQFLMKEMKLEPFVDIPFWIPLDDDPEPGFYQISNEKAKQIGLVFTDFKNTVRVSFDSLQNKRFIAEKDTGFTFGISAEKEKEVIALWKQRQTESR